MGGGSNVNSSNSENSVYSVNSENRENNVLAVYITVLPPSLMVFLVFVFVFVHEDTYLQLSGLSW